MTDAFPKPGETFALRYQVGALIGSGGFARVYMARDKDLGREVALKILTPNEDQGAEKYDANLVERFDQEARLVSRLRDNHTITMFDYGRAENGLLFMVFEFINGVSLARLIQNEGALAPERVVKILKQMLSSLEEAHALGVMHRDLKPGNIMVFEHVGRRDQAKLLDFGIAKLTSATKTLKGDLTADGALIGTPRYMAPEQIRGKEVTPQSDIYSLGLVAYEMVIGRKAIESNSSVTIIGQQLDPQPFFVPQRANIPEGLRTIINRMLSKDTDVRYRTARQVMEQLENWKDPALLGNSPDEDDLSTAILSADISASLTDVMPDISDDIVPLVEETPTNAALSGEFVAAAMHREPSGQRVPIQARDSYPPGSLPLMQPASDSYPPGVLSPPPTHQRDPSGTQNPVRQSYPPGTLDPRQSYPPGTLDPVRQSYPPGALASMPGVMPTSDPSVYIVPQQPNKTVWVLGAAVIVMLCTIVGFVVYTATRSDAPAVAEVEPVITSPIEEKVIEKPEPPAAADRQMVLRSSPTGLEISVNGKPMGTTPVTLREDAAKFPMTVRVRKGDASKKMVVNTYQDDILIEAPMLDAAAVADAAPEKPAVEPVAKPVEPKPAVKKASAKKVVRKKAKTKTKSNVIASSKDEPKVEPEAKKEEKKKTTLELPAMDL